MSKNKIKVFIISIGIVVTLAIVFFMITTPSGFKTLVKDGPSVISRNTNDKLAEGYEVIDLRTKKVWLTTDFTTEEFEALKIPLLWRKNDSVREAWFDKSKFLKSPGCTENNNYNESLMFEKQFLHVCTIIELPTNVDESELMTRTILQKYHEVTFSSGRLIKVIVSPEGKRYIMMTRELDSNKDVPNLPDGWKLEEGILSKDLTVVLSGRNEIIRTDNNDSFQGPLGEDFDINEYVNFL